MILAQGKRWVLAATYQNYPLFNIWHYGDYYNSHTGFAFLGISINLEYVHWKPK
jgi:hypothetical protein